MTSTVVTPVAEARRSLPGRLLAGLDHPGTSLDLKAHLAQWGPLRLAAHPRSLVEEIEASGLMGRGGAAFPVAAKWRAVHARGRRHPVVVANGAEGEPASRKDAVLLAATPHLVIDGACATAYALGASDVVLYVPAESAGNLERAIGERRSAGDGGIAVSVVVAPDAFVAGQETAVVSVLNGRAAARPTFSGLVSIRERGVAGRPTLVHNVETLAHVGLIARFGARWFRSVGSPTEPGTRLLTLTGRFAGPVVVEVPTGTPFGRILNLDPSETPRVRGVLLGGYGGVWLPAGDVLGLGASEADARRAGATLGAGVVALLANGVCPLAEVARLVSYLAEEGAGQCGPCVHGLADLGRRFHALAHGRRPRHEDLVGIVRTCSLVEGRGACRHPDGVARMVESACRVFADEIARHHERGPCAGTAGAFPLPRRRAGGGSEARR